MRAKRWTMSLTAFREYRIRGPVYWRAMQWLDLLPHQPPMRLLEEVVSVGPGKEAVGGGWRSLKIFIFKDTFRTILSFPPSSWSRWWRRSAGSPPGRRKPAKRHDLAASRGGHWPVQISRRGETGCASRSIGPRCRQSRGPLQNRRRCHRRRNRRGDRKPDARRLELRDAFDFHEQFRTADLRERRRSRVRARGQRLTRMLATRSASAADVTYTRRSTRRCSGARAHAIAVRRSNERLQIQ